MSKQLTDPTPATFRDPVRGLVLQILYEIDIVRQLPSDIDIVQHLPGDTIYAHLSQSDLGEGKTDLVRELVVGTLANREEIDQKIGEAAPEWPVETIAFVDLNILRLAIYELLYKKTSAVSTTVNKAVELGSEFGSESSKRFINGVLRNIARKWLNSE